MELPPLLSRINAGPGACLAILDNLPKVRRKAADNALFSVYQYWVHQNPGTHQDVGINEDGKWQDMWEKLLCFPSQRYEVTSGCVGKEFVSNLVAELNGIRHRKCKYDRVIVFQSVILKLVRLVTGAKNICAQIYS